jgi:hypothetical protein
MLFDRFHHYFYGLFLLYVFYLAYCENTTTIGYAFLCLSTVFFVSSSYQSVIIICSIVLSYLFSQYSVFESFQDDIDYNCVEMRMKYEETLDAKNRIIADNKVEGKTLKNNINMLQSKLRERNGRIKRKNTRIQRLKQKKNALRQYKSTVFNMSKI